MQRIKRDLKEDNRILVRGIEDIRAIEEVPLETRLPATNSYDAILKSAIRHPEKAALICLPAAGGNDESRIISYTALISRINQTANAFHSLGIGPTDVVSFVLPSVPQAIYTFFGGSAAGIANPINPLLKVDEIADMMNAANSKVLVAAGPDLQPDIWDKVSQIWEKVPSLQAVLRVGGSDAVANVLEFDEFVDGFPSDQLTTNRVINPSDIAAYFHTGGTTGTPKLAPHTHFAEVCNTWSLMEYTFECTSDDVITNGLPMFHVAGILLSVLGPLTFGASIVILAPGGFRDPEILDNLWKTAERYGVTLLAAIPTIYSALIDIPVGDADISKVRFAISGAAPLPVEVLKKFEANTGLMMIEGYGLTEGTNISTYNPPRGARRYGSIGLRLPYHNMKIVKLDAEGIYQRDCAPQEIGAVCIKGPNVFSGYKEARHNTGLWIQEDWFNTGDLGRQDEEGYFWLTGRSKDLIKRSGHGIDPASIESVLHRHSAVAMAAVVGRPDSYAGEVPVAYIVLKSGEKASAEELRAFAQAHAPEPPATPSQVFIVDEIPKTAVGKIFKPPLRYDATRRALEAALAPLAFVQRGVTRTVKVAGDPVHGAVAAITLGKVEPSRRSLLETRTHELLAPYCVHFEVDSGTEPARKP